MKGKAPFFMLVLLLAKLTALWGQDYVVARQFTVADGLPSNHIYTTTQDNQGFLWVATDAGIARFDGKNFQVFTRENGLPDNEVLDVVKERNGRIWVNCYRQSPAYFDPVKNRFISAYDDPVLATMQGANLVNLFALPQGGVQYVNEKGSYVFDQGKVFFTPKNNYQKWYLLYRDKQGYEVHYSMRGQKSNNAYYINLWKNNQVVDSFVFAQPYQYNARPFLNNGHFYFLYPAKGELVVFSQFSTQPFGFSRDTIRVNEPITYVTFSGGLINVVGGSGVIYVYHPQTLALQQVFKGPFIANSLSRDKQGNFWLGSIDKGLFLYKKQNIKTLPFPPQFNNRHLLSLARLGNGTLVAGNLNSELLFWQNGPSKVMHLPTPVNSYWQRKILEQGGKLFSFSEGGTYVDLKRRIRKAPGKGYIFEKTAIPDTDTSILVGTSQGLARLNIFSEKINLLHGPSKRVTALAKAGKNLVYFGSTDGLYVHDLEKDSGWGLQAQHPLFKERIVALCTAPEGWVWAATAGQGVFAFKDNKLLAQFNQQKGLLSNTAIALHAPQKGSLWVGSQSGLSHLQYLPQHNGWTGKVNNITYNDGLSSNLVNEILVHKDSVYVATGEGLNVLSSHWQAALQATPVALLGVKINQRDTTISTTYQLRSHQGNITLKLAAIDLEGRSRYIQYRFKGQENWSKLETATLNLELQPGNHLIECRSVDVNENPSPVSLVIQFNLASPFWKSSWFLVVVFFVLSVLVSFWVISRVGRRNQKLISKLKQDQQLQELEMKALRAQINPHFVFNCLSAIKSLNYQQKNKEAGLFIDRFSALLRHTLDFTSRDTIRLQEELDYARNYLALEKMRFGDRMDWKIITPPGLDLEAWVVPPLILQPYLENAIKHGLNHKTDGKGLLEINLSVSASTLHFKITDNGVGRKAAQAIHAKDPHYHVPKGLEISARRAQLFGGWVQLSDLTGHHNEIWGTIVDLYLPQQSK